jgi:hypothetical protein
LYCAQPGLNPKYSSRPQYAGSFRIAYAPTGHRASPELRSIFAYTIDDDAPGDAFSS